MLAIVRYEFVVFTYVVYFTAISLTQFPIILFSIHVKRLTVNDGVKYLSWIVVVVLQVIVW